MRTALHRGDAPRRLRRRPPRSRVATRSLRDGLRPPLTREPLRHLTDQHHGQARWPAPGARGAPFRSQDHINQKSLRFQGSPRFRHRWVVR